MAFMPHILQDKTAVHSLQWHGTMQQPFAVLTIEACSVVIVLHIDAKHLAPTVLSCITQMLTVVLMVHLH